MELGLAIYRSVEGRSVTSLAEFYDGHTEVYYCGACGHLQTTEINDIPAYYDTQYNIFVDDDEEDMLYRVVDGQNVFRVEHQVDTLLKKIALPPNARVLDFGCAKSLTSRKLLEVRPDLRVHLFDVSKAYVRFWEKFVTPDRWAVYTPRADWDESFDAVFSFFALEHVAAPRTFVASLERLIKPDGYLYLLVPNVYANPADFVVVDHVNHFSSISLQKLLNDADFGSITVDENAHDAAFVVVARKSADVRPLASDAQALAALRDRAKELSVFWGEVSARIRAFERQHAGNRAVIYGSGFYGTFIASCLENITNIECFLDQNPFRQSKKLLEKPILAPDAVQPGVDVVYVGLNPRIARGTIERLDVFKTHPRQFFYL